MYTGRKRPNRSAIVVGRRVDTEGIGRVRYNSNSEIRNRR